MLTAAALSIALTAVAQQAPCGLTSMTETAQPLYPPIAKAAHVEGVVVLLVDFELTGAAHRIQVITGPEMLRYSATASVKTWRANPYSGPRTCPVAINFHLNRSGEHLPPVVRSDVQHIIVNSDSPMLETTMYSIAAPTRPVLPDSPYKLAR